MKKNNYFKKPIALLLSVTMALSLTVSMDAFAKQLDNDKYKAGLDNPEIVTEEITQEEYDEIVKKDGLKSIYNSVKYTDDYWSQFSKPYYEYEDNLNEEQKNLYNKLYMSLYGMIDGGCDLDEMIWDDRYLTPAVTCTGLTEEEAGYVGLLIAYEHPEFYFLNSGLKTEEVKGTDERTLQLCVYMDFQTGEDRANYAPIVKESIKWYQDQITGDTLYEREKSIHDLICINTEYDGSSEYAQSCASVFLEGKSVCAGYSEAFNLLCNAEGIPAIAVTSEKHEWSQVKLGGYWYAVDVTWDDEFTEEGDEISYEFFDVSDESLGKGSAYNKEMHTVEEIPWDYVGRPECLYDYGDAPIISVDVYRLYNSNTGEHFYTIKNDEVTFLSSIGWNYEGEAWKAPETASDNEAVYRLYNPNTTDHFYTNKKDEMQNLIDNGWNYEGICWYSDPDEAVALYRLYNPNAEIGSHHYTMNNEECTNLIQAGWIYEGIAWYGM